MLCTCSEGGDVLYFEVSCIRGCVFLYVYYYQLSCFSTVVVLCFCLMWTCRFSIIS